ncbi:MAG: hypothetical protein J0H64_09390 [Actinobacteria bacterium]|nr:hypothetical protein [Actinomycetota bacterium]
MNFTHHLARTTASIAVAALAAAGLAVTATSAHATGAFDKLTLQHAAAVNWGGTCKTNNYSDDVPDQITMTEGAAVSSHASVAERVASVANGNDYVDATASVTGTAKATGQAGQPRSVELSFHGSGSTTASQGGSSCAAEPWASLKLRFELTLAQPMWATLSYSKIGAARANLELGDKFQSPDEYLDSIHWKGSGSTTVLIPAGEYIGYVDGQTYMVASKVTKSMTGSGTVKMTFTPAGSAVSGPSGKAQSYAALGAARNCTVHALPAKLTTSAKKIKRIKKISFAVNGKTVKTLRGTKIRRGLAVILRLNDGSPVSVNTTVRLKNGASYTARANYRPCA